jgi:hypothetical protein
MTAIENIYIYLDLNGSENNSRHERSTYIHTHTCKYTHAHTQPHVCLCMHTLSHTQIYTNTFSNLRWKIALNCFNWHQVFQERLIIFSICLLLICLGKYISVFIFMHIL